MKNIMSLIVGMLLIFISNSILNFIPTDNKIEPILIYIILISIYSSQNEYFLYFLAAFLGLIQDASIGMYAGVYTLLFLVIMLVGTFVKNQIRKDYFITAFTLCLIYVVFSCIYLGFITQNIVVIPILYYLIKTMFLISILILIINNIIKKMEK